MEFPFKLTEVYILSFIVHFVIEQKVIQNKLFHLSILTIVTCQIMTSVSVSSQRFFQFLL